MTRGTLWRPATAAVVGYPLNADATAPTIPALPVATSGDVTVTVTIDTRAASYGPMWPPPNRRERRAGRFAR